MIDYTIRDLTPEHLDAATAVWNEIVAEGDSFPGDRVLYRQEAEAMFREQTAVRCVFLGDELAALYILHPNGIGHCAHIANASYAVAKAHRGKGLGRALVEDCIKRAKAHRFAALQFNAVVSTNQSAVCLYLKLGFSVIGTIPGGFRKADGSVCDTLIFLKSW